jgi:hypothetical protein
MSESVDTFVGDENLMVFSHPNHELAVYGLIQKLKPRLIYLTDGGGRERVAQTEEGLAKIGLLQRATFLPFTEDQFYQGLLDHDHGLFEKVTMALAGAMDMGPFDRVFCDAVEFYNPVHDIALPLVRAALNTIHRDGCPIFEVPLIFQVPGPEEKYTCQRLPQMEAEAEIAFDLDDSQAKNKRVASEAVYTLLQAQLRPALGAPPEALIQREVVMRAPVELRLPGPGRVLRYEWRAQRLFDAGKIKRKITHAGHFLPVAESLLGHVQAR